LQSTTPAPTNQPAEDTETNDNDTTVPEQSNAQQETATEEPSTQEVTLSAEERPQQLEIVKSFLEYPGVKDEPVEKKREFLESKGIAQSMIRSLVLSQHHHHNLQSVLPNLPASRKPHNPQEHNHNHPL
jgi:ribosome-binding ATPase YchF (GTP1/OBG family)